MTATTSPLARPWLHNRPRGTSQQAVKVQRTALEYAIWQAEHIGWPALAESYRQELAAFEAAQRGAK